MNWLPFWVSFQLATWVTALLLTLGLPLAWALARSRSRIASFVEALTSLPMVLSPTVLGFYLLIALSPHSPFGAFFSKVLGIQLTFSFAGLVIAGVISGLPFMLSPLKSAMATVPDTLLEASYTLGKGRMATFIRIVLPQIRTGLLSGVVMAFTHTLGEFGVVMMVGGSIPGATKVISVAIYEQVEATDFASAHAYALVLIAIVLPAVFLLHHLQRREVRR